MKYLIVNILGYLVVFVLVTVPIFGASGQEWDKDNYGRVIGQLVDEDTGEPVNEVFKVLFLDSKRDHYGFNIEQRDYTDESGRFVLELLPYIYYIEFFPKSRDSRYAHIPYPFKVEEKDRVTLKVEKGKITYAKIKAPLAGRLNIFMADMNNVKFNPSEIFSQKFRIVTSIAYPLHIGINYGRDDLDDDGQLTAGRLYPGVYSVNVRFEGLGYPAVKRENIIVEKGKTTEVLINIDLNDNTGLEGVVRDINGIPLEGVDILLGLKTGKFTGYSVATSNENGRYEINGLPEGYYYLNIGVNKIKGYAVFSYKDHDEVEIKKGISSRLDISLEYAKDELEKK